MISKIKISIYVSIMLSLLTIIGCSLLEEERYAFQNENFWDEEYISERLKACYPAIEHSVFFDSLSLHDIDHNLQELYEQSNYQLLWFNDQGLKSAGNLFLTQINSLWDEGLNPGKYGVSNIQNVTFILEDSFSQSLITLDSIIKWDIMFSRVYLQAAKDLLFGIQHIQRNDTNWLIDNDSAFDGVSYLYEQLQQSDEFPSFDAFRPDFDQYTLYRLAVKEFQVLQQDSVYMQAKRAILHQYSDSLALLIISRELRQAKIPTLDSVANRKHFLLMTYQYYRGLLPTGEVDNATLSALSKMPDSYIAQLKINQERLRSMPRKNGREYLWSNIPMMQMVYMKDKQIVFSAKTVVGRKSRQSPSLAASLTSIMFNPPRGEVPPAILKKDIGKGIEKKGIRYLYEKNLKAYDKDGQEVTEIVTTHNYHTFSYKQAPGVKNALGDIKFNIPNKLYVFLHDNPNKNEFNRADRMLSSGCIRVENAKILAEKILESEFYTSYHIDSIIRTRKTKQEDVEREIVSYVVYLTVDLDSSGNYLRFVNDIYEKDIYFLN